MIEITILKSIVVCDHINVMSDDDIDNFFYHYCTNRHNLFYGHHDYWYNVPS